MEFNSRSCYNTKAMRRIIALTVNFLLALSLYAQNISDVESLCQKAAAAAKYCLIPEQLLYLKRVLYREESACFLHEFANMFRRMNLS